MDSGYTVRALVRDPARLQGRPWSDQIEVSQGDVLDRASLSQALAGVDAAYYLIHSMGSGDQFHERDMIAARNFSQVAAQQGVQRILYLGGLGDPDADLSHHLRSRQQTGDALRESGVPVTELRAAVIVGSGSTSFEIIRYLTERIPVMICPRWVYTNIQPIAIRDVLSYLVQSLTVAESAGEIIEIGGPDVMSYGEMMMTYARVRGLKRYLVPVPALTPGLSAHWVHWMTPVPAQIARPLIQGLRNEVIVRDDKAQRLFPQIQPITHQRAVELALEKLHAQEVETAWSDALLSSQGDRQPAVLQEREGMILERRERRVDAPPATVFAAYTRLGGKTGWLAFNWAWYARGVMDRMVGGVGFRRGRRDAYDVRVGDALDFWRVEAVESPRLMRLRAEMKVPGLAWLQFESVAAEADGQEGSTTLIQTAFFAPKGLFGLIYWYGIYPIHGAIFSILADRLKEMAEELHRNGDT
jgi:uncharacterized protein YbjT (DUF2867 family)